MCLLIARRCVISLQAGIFFTVKETPSDHGLREIVAHYDSDNLSPILIRINSVQIEGARCVTS